MIIVCSIVVFVEYLDDVNNFGRQIKISWLVYFSNVTAANETGFQRLLLCQLHCSAVGIRSR